jgi:hypothetical protein
MHTLFRFMKGEGLMDGFDFESIFKKHKEEINEAVNASEANPDAMAEGVKAMMQLFRAMYVGAVEAGFSKSAAMSIATNLLTNIIGQFINQGR